MTYQDRHRIIGPLIIFLWICVAATDGGMGWLIAILLVSGFSLLDHLRHPPLRGVP